MSININKLIDSVIKEVEETTIISTPSGTTADATTDQKKQATDATSKGDTVKVVKKGTQVTEEDHEEPDGDEGNDDRTHIDIFTCDDDTHADMSNADHAAKHIAETIGILAKLSESDDKKAKRYSDNVIGYLNKAKTALEALSKHEVKLGEQKQAKDTKEAEKALKSVEKALSKTLRNPDLVAKIMKKYPVSKAIEMQNKAGKDMDATKVAEAILKVSLKEQYHIKEESAVDKAKKISATKKEMRVKLDEIKKDMVDLKQELSKYIKL